MIRFKHKKDVPPVLPHINTEKMAQQFDVDRQAIQQGQRNQPATTASGPDAAERGIVQGVHVMHGEVTDLYAKCLDEAQARQTQLAAHWAPERLEECYEAAKHGHMMLAVASHDPLAAAWQWGRETQLDLRAFRQQYNLSREALYPANRTWHVAILMAMVLVETLANMTFFAHGLDGGIVAALFEALVVASLNVATAFCGGNVLRGLNSRGWRRLLAALTGLGYVGFMGLYHFMVGHYRMVLAHARDDAATVALTSFLNDPLGLTDIYSWLLVLVGMLFGIIALIDGYTFDDPVPGYGALTRRFKAAEVAYTRLKEAYLTDIQTVADTHTDLVDTRCEEAREAMVAYRTQMAETRQLVRRYQEVSIALAEACMALQRRYRAKNAAVRDTEAPAYFAEEPPRPFEPEASLVKGFATVAEAEELVLNFRQELHDLHTRAVDVKRRILALSASYLSAAPGYFAQIEARGMSPTTHHADGVVTSQAPDALTPEEVSHDGQ